MTRFLTTLALLLCVACGGDSDPIATVSNGSIRGTITDNVGATVANAAVSLTGNAQAARTTLTGADGVYTFGDLPPGTYALTVTPPTGFTISSAGTASVTVASKTQADVSAFVLNRVPPPLSPDSAFVAEVRARLTATAATNQFSGAVLVVRNGITLFEGAVGLADRELGIANTPLTRFRVGSMNKMITAVATLQLVQAGKLSLYEPIDTYLANYPNADLAAKVTIHNLLTHTGGTGDIFGSQFTANRTELRTLSDYIDLFGSRGLEFAPGTAWAYSNYGFILLGAIIERVSGMSYDDYVATHVFAPAGMTATAALPEDSIVPGRSIGYMWQGGTLISNAPTLPYRGTSAGGGYSTVADFARFAAALREHKLLNATHTALLITGKVTMGQVPVKYAYGFIDRNVFGRRLVGHSGGAAGMNGELSFEPGGGYTVVVLSNLSPPAASQMESFILERLP